MNAQRREAVTGTTTSVPGPHQRWCEIEATYERMRREDPDGWTDYLGELAEWEAGTTATDSTAAQEWPEYNR